MAASSTHMIQWIIASLDHLREREREGQVPWKEKEHKRGNQSPTFVATKQQNTGGGNVCRWIPRWPPMFITWLVDPHLLIDMLSIPRKMWFQTAYYKCELITSTGTRTRERELIGVRPPQPLGASPHHYHQCYWLYQWGPVLPAPLRSPWGWRLWLEGWRL